MVKWPKAKQTHRLQDRAKKLGRRDIVTFTDKETKKLLPGSIYVYGTCLYYVDERGDTRQVIGLVAGEGDAPA
jgi:hypothetical protein